MNKNERTAENPFAPYERADFPVVITDTAYTTLYLNPAALKSVYIPATADCISRLLDVASKDSLLHALDWTPRLVLQNIGSYRPRKMLIKRIKQEGLLIFTFRPYGKEPINEETLGYEQLLRSSLHQLLTTCDLLQDAKNKVSEKTLHYVYRSLATARYHCFVNDTPRTTVFSPEKLLRGLHGELCGELPDHKLILSAPSEPLAAKCDIMMTRSVLVKATIALLIREKKKEACLTLSQKGDYICAELTSGKDFPDTKPLDSPLMIAANADFTEINRLMQVQEGKAEFYVGSKNAIRLLFPCADIGFLSPIPLSEQIDRSLPDVKIELSHLI